MTPRNTQSMIDSCALAFRLLRNGCILFWPLPLIAYVLGQGGNQKIVQSGLLHVGIVSTVLVLVAAGAAVAYQGYARTREPILRYLVVGLAACGTTFVLHIALDVTIDHNGLFMLEVGAEARAIMVIVLALALFQWHSPPDDFDQSTSLSALVVSWAGALLVEALVLIIAQVDQAGLFLQACEIIDIGLGCVSVIFISVRTPNNQALFRAVLTMVLFVQSSLCFLIGAPWSHLWWLGHGLFAFAILSLGYSTVLAYVTRQSFVGAKSEGEVIELMRQAEAAARDAERANAAKTRFMAAASHDLRQPLVPIKLFSELLEFELKEPGQLALVRKLRGSIQSLDDLLGKLLEFSRVESGTLQPRAERVRLGDVLARLHQEFEPVAAEKNLAFRYVPTGVLVRTDRILLEQMLRNLIENAIRYTHAGGIVLGCRSRGKQIAIEVVDTGLGIPPEQQKAIFTEFFQAEAYASDRRLGFGLGLATVDRLSRLLGHPIEVHSIPGKGSRFSVVVPKASERRTRIRSLVQPVLPDPGMLRLLLVDDDREVRDGVVTTILRRGWEPLVATNVAEAVETVQSEGLPDVIVTDLRLEQNLCGLDVLDRIQSLELGPISAVIITGDASHHRLGEALRSPWKVLVKPFSADEFYNAVTEAYLKLNQEELE